MSNRKTSAIGTLFGNLKVRPKLMVLHNLFFLLLACAAYFALIPLFKELASQTRAPEASVATAAPAGASREPTQQSYEQTVSKAQLTLFLILGGIYILAVVALEAAIMPLYVYRPIRRMLAADSATQAGDREGELIPPDEILGDEIGQIMRSRNETVTTLRRREDELAAALRRIEEQDRLVSLGLLSASVAHELNTPLAVLNGSIEKLMETTRDPQTLERLERMQRVAQRLRRISESLVDFSKVRTQKMESTPVRPLIEEAWSLVAIDEKSLTTDFSNRVSDGHCVVGNSDRLLQVFVNLLRNALNAVEATRGRIEVNSKRETRNGRPCIVVTVADNGPGIPAHALHDIFDAFVTTRLDARGTGLGLTVSEGIIRQHGGAITAANRPEGGACLEVVLPAA